MDPLPNMDYPDLDQIKDYCQEALERSDQYGLDDGLSFLIGSKFYAVFRQLREEQNRMLFLYDEFDESVGCAFEDKTLRMNYASDVNDSYRNIMERVKTLEDTQNEFITEITHSFDANDIKSYLLGYPRVGADLEFYAQSGGTRVAPLSSQEALSEAREILYVDEMMRLFE